MIWTDSICQYMHVYASICTYIRTMNVFIYRPIIGPISRYVSFSMYFVANLCNVCFYCAGITGWNKGQFPEDVLQWNDIHNRFRGLKVKQVSSNQSSGQSSWLISTRISGAHWHSMRWHAAVYSPLQVAETLQNGHFQFHIPSYVHIRSYTCIYLHIRTIYAHTCFSHLSVLCPLNLHTHIY